MATKCCEISTLLLSVCTVDQSKVEISQNFVAFSEYKNFMRITQKQIEAMVQGFFKIEINGLDIWELWEIK